MPEHIPGSNMVKLLEGEYAIATDDRRIDGEQIVRVQEFDLDVVLVQGSVMYKQIPTVEAKWEVKANDLEDFMKKVQKNS